MIEVSASVARGDSSHTIRTGRNEGYSAASPADLSFLDSSNQLLFPVSLK